jgi:hypothetical protein
MRVQIQRAAGVRVALSKLARCCRSRVLLPEVA